MFIAGGASAGFCDDCCAGCFEGLISQALSSKPLTSFFGGAGAWARGVSVRSLVFSLRASFDFNILASTTSLLCTGAAGWLLRVLFLRAPPGPEKRPPPALSGDVAPPVISALAPSTRLSRVNFNLPVRPNLVSKYFITRNISPSLRPNVRNTGAVISGSTFSSIESFEKLNAYLSH